MRTVTILLLVLAGLAPAQGRRPPLQHPTPPWPPRMVQLLSVSVEATIQDAGVQTEVKAIFENRGGVDGEADWIFPLPPGSVVHRSKLTIDGQEVPAETLEAEQARRIYQSIVAKLRDPLLLEYAGWGVVRARIFPVPAGGRAEARFSMTALLPEAGGIREYLFPFKALAGGGTPPKSLAAHVSIRSAQALGPVYSPTPGVEILRESASEALASWEGGGVPERDLRLFFSPAEQEFGVLPLFHARRAGEGTFMAVLSPAREPADSEEIPKTVIFVVDTSGSMRGIKMTQTRAALRFFLKSLRPSDAFNLIPFASTVRPLFPGPQAVSEQALQEALDAVKRLQAAGGTNIQDALVEALNLPEDGRLPIIVFLTDGQPTVRETDPRRIVDRVKDANRRQARLFVLGVGNDVNTFLLDRLAEEGRGDRHYIGEREDIEVKVSSLLQRISRPALSEVRLSLEGGVLEKLTPMLLPDLFHGTTLTVLGQFRGAGKAELILQGTIGGQERSWRYPLSLPESPTADAWLEPLWAQRRVAELLDQIRLYGQSKELVDEVLLLGKKHGMVTPWTSHLVAEEAERLARGADLDAGEGWAGLRGLLGMASRTRPSGPSTRAPRMYRGPGGQDPPATPPPMTPAGPGARAPSTPATPGMPSPSEPQAGAEAIGRSRLLDQLRRSEVPEQPGGAQEGRVRRLAGKVFLLIEQTWVDQAFQAGMKEKMQTIEAFSPDYFALLAQHPDASRWLAPGGRILLVLDGKAYLITP